MKKFRQVLLFAFCFCAVLPVFAQSGNVLSLNGTDAYMSVADHPDLDIAPGQTKTITCWIRTTSSAQARLIAKRSDQNTQNPSTPGTTGTGYELWMGDGSNAGKIAGNAAAWNTTASASTSFSTTSYTASTANDGTWHHLAAVFDNSGSNKSVTFYLDGSSPITRAGTFPNSYDFSTGVAFIIGAASDGTRFFAGQIDNVRFWNRAMTQAQVQSDITTTISGPVANLLAAWDFEGVVGTMVPDLSGNNHSGMLNGGAEIITAPSNRVLQLDGLPGTYMSVENHPDLNIGSGQSYTISCRVKTTTAVANPRILAKRTGTSGTAVGYEFISSGSGQFGANLRSTPVSAGPAFSTATINNGQWHHLALVVDQVAGISRIYVDGVLDKSSNTWATPQDFSNAVNLYVGADATAGHANLWKGQIDDIRLWNKAMTGVEVAADASSKITGATANLMACWDFEGTTGITVPDVSGNKHSGTLNGNASVVDLSSNLMSYQATSLLQTELPVGKGDAAQRIIAVNITTSGFINPLSLTSLRFTMNGTTSLADVASVKIYFTGSSNRFAPINLFATAAPQAGVITATGAQTLLSADNYFWIAYDVGANATEGNLLDATCEGITISGTLYNFTSPNNTVAGSRSIFLTHTLLFSSGDYGSSNYRIPALVTAADGSLVTVTDKRYNGAGDLRAKIDPVVRRSTDGGKTWSEPVTIANFGGPNGAGDAALVLDKIKNPGTLLCVFAADQGFGASTPSNPIKIQYCKSTDNGISWSAPVDITNQVYGSGCSDPVRKNWYAAFLASGRMQQLRSGKIAGVLVVRQNASGPYDNFMLYSDDGGSTWSVSPGVAAAGQADEAKIVELANGNLLMSTRHSGARRISISTDGGQTWGSATVQNQLPEPGCNGDLIRYSSTQDGNTQNVLLHSIPANTGTRKNVTVFISKDEGLSWSLLKTIFPGSSAYSSLTVLPDGSVGVYYECGEYETYQMYFARFSTPELLMALPVKLTGFTAACTNNGISLSWQTVQEVNTRHFEIQSRNDGSTWNKVATVSASTDSRTPQTYRYNDAHTTGKYYRLEIQDNDGHIAYSKVAAVNCGRAAWQVSSSANPVSDRLELRLKGPVQSSVNIAFVNALGQTVLQQTQSLIAGKLVVPIATLPKGLYYVKVDDGVFLQTINVVKQ